MKVMHKFGWKNTRCLFLIVLMTFVKKDKNSQPVKRRDGVTFDCLILNNFSFRLSLSLFLSSYLENAVTSFKLWINFFICVGLMNQLFQSCWDMWLNWILQTKAWLHHAIICSLFIFISISLAKSSRLIMKRIFVTFSTVFSIFAARVIILWS